MSDSKKLSEHNIHRRKLNNSYLANAYQHKKKKPVEVKTVEANKSNETEELTLF